MKTFSKILIQISLISCLLLSVHSTVYALGEYTVLAPLPGIGDDNAPTTLEKWLPKAFTLAIAVAAVLAFVMITFGGIMYATSDAITGKSQGKEYVTDAIYGLLLVIGAWVILNTINPKILHFELNPEKIVLDNSTNPPVSTTGGGITGGGAGCQGICSHQYTSGGTVINYKDCSSCTDAVATGLSIRNPTINGQKAQMNADLATKLKGVENGMGSGVDFDVTETWPPTRDHVAQGQYDGTSVDVSLKNKTPASVSSFIQSSQAQGLRVQYEVQNSAQLQPYLQAGIPKCEGQGGSGCVRIVPEASGEHFSVYKN